jgi:hypothetical protein
MAIFEKELGNGDFPLPTRHFEGGGGWGLPVSHKMHFLLISTTFPLPLDQDQYRFTLGVVQRWPNQLRCAI